ncbi:MAG: substrate-binding domain-containing protein [Clostridiaceae bacterium]
MYLPIQDVFWVPVYYAEEDILSIIERVMLEEFNYYRNLTNEPMKRKEIVIGVALPDRIVPRWPRIKGYMEQYASTKDGVTLKIENADFDAARQASQVDSLISQGIDVLILVPVDLFAAASLVEKAHKAGIKVIDFDRLIQNSDADLYISFDGQKVGELQGQYLTKEVPRGNYIILSGDPGNFNSTLYKKGAMEYIQPRVSIGNIKIVEDKAVKNWDPKISFKIVKDALIANKNNVDAILAPNDTTAGGAIEALKEQGLAGKVVVTGQNADLPAVRRIIEGTQSMTVFKDDREESRIAIDAAIKLAENKPIAVDKYVNNGKINVPSIFLTPIAVDRNNINEVLIASGYLEASEVYGA